MAERGSSDRDLGRMAESRLEDWAAQVNITANKSTNDREGWDHFLQFPHPFVETGTPLDRRESRIECLVQVKGTTEKQVRKSIKLSNWAKLVESPFPAFFLIVVYSESSEPVSAYLVHVGEEYINWVLERLRQLRGVDEDTLNGHRMVVRWTDSDALSTLDGPGLQKAIESHIPNGMEEYSRWMFDTRSTAGDPVPTLLRWTKEFASSDEAWNEIVELAIGIRDEITVPNMLFEEDVRFSIPSSTKDLGEGTLKITSRSGIECNVEFRESEIAQASSFKAQLYNTRMFLGDIDVPSQFNKWRVVFELGSLVVEIGSGTGNLTINFPPFDKEYPLDELVNIWRLAGILSRGETVDVSITDFGDSGHVVNAQLSVDDKSFAKDDLAKYWEVVNNTRWLLNILDIPPESRSSIAQLLLQQKDIALLRSVFDASETDIRFSANVSSSDIGEMSKKRLSLPFARILRLGDTIVIVLFAIAGDLGLTGKEDDDSYGIELLNAHCVHLEYEKFSKDTMPPIESKFDELKDKLDSDGFHVLINE